MRGNQINVKDTGLVIMHGVKNYMPAKNKEKQICVEQPKTR